MLEAHGRLFAVEERVGLEVVLEAAEVYVGGAACGERVVAHEHLAVQEACRVEVYLNPCAHHVAQVGTPCPLYEARVAARRHYDAYVDAAQRSGLQGEEHRLRGQEVGRLDVYVAARPEDYAHVSLHDLGVRGYGAGRHYLRYAGRLHAAVGLRVVLAAGDERAVHEVPVYEKRPLQAVDSPSGDAHHGVAPRLAACSLGIAQRYVHAAYEPLAPVDDDNLAVVAVVGLAGEGREPHGQERPYVHTALAHTLKEAVADVPAAHVVVYHPHLHAPAGTVHERVGHEAAQRVVRKDVYVNVYVVAGPAYGGEQLEEEGVAIGDDADPGVVERQGHVLVHEEVYRGTVALGQAQVALLGELEHRPLCELVHAALAHHALLAGVYAEEHVEHYAHHRHEEDDQRPGHGLGRLAVVHEHMDDGHSR